MDSNITNIVLLIFVIVKQLKKRYHTVKPAHNDNILCLFSPAPN